MIKVSKLVWGSGFFSHGAIRYHSQVLALDSRAERCRAGVAVLAAMMGDSKRTGERYLAELTGPGPAGVPETEVIRHTDPGGRGTTAERRVRVPGKGEHFAYVPVCACKALRPTLYVLYLALAYADAMGLAVTAGELAELLGVTERTVRRLLAELAAPGWITVEHRAGYQGRHQITVNGCPGHAGPDAPSPDTDGGSGPDTNGGSLASKEDPGLTDKSTTQVGGAFRRRRGDRKWAAAPVDTPGNATPATFRSAPRTACPPSAEPLTLPPRVWAVLEPVRDLLPGLRPFVLRRIRDEVARQLDTGVLAEDITDQLRLLRAWTPHENLTDPGRWILGAALPAQPGPCGLTDCIRGFMRHTGAPCKACADHRTRPATPAPAPAPPPPRQAPPPHATARYEKLRHAEQIARQQHAAAGRERAALLQQLAANGQTLPLSAVYGPQQPADDEPPPARVGPPPDPGGWRALVARERPADAARTYRHRWTGDHAQLLPPETA
ncbi:hypothetical protein ACPXCS_06130 [Streptomyces sp. DT190]|uniref:hypothetical protein n=1 Tax=unclassified Streptomyces TaxID=2593676 RepID=UPI003CF52D4B